MSPRHAGQIVRIHLENFMSYDNIEIHPGCNLNLIIGPNGTGKSSIVCAVLLCLGGKLKTLGRADQLSSYIKSGCSQSIIEIELYNPNGINNIIKRKLLPSNHSEFSINGKTASAGKVNDLKRNYNIQVDNLCTFLPQEKVQDFAKLNSLQLLDQTQKVLEDGKLIQLYESLKDLQSKAECEEKHCENLQMELDKEIQKNERIKDQVQSFKERQILFEQLALLNQKLAWSNYEKAVEEKNDINKDKKLAEDIYLEKQKLLKNCEKEIENINNSLEPLEKLVSEAKKNEVGKEAAMQDRLRRAESRIEELQNFENTLQLKLNEENEKRKEMIKYQENAEKLKNDLKNLEATIGSEASFNSQVKEAEESFKKLHEEEDRLNQTKFTFEEKEDSLKQQSRRLSQEYQNLKQRKNLRIEYLKKNEPDAYRSMEWLEKNRHLFQSRIYNPMLLELDVPKTEMAKFIEARISYRDLISFTCTNPDDLNLLVQKLRGEQKLKVNVICSDECDNSQYMPEIPISDLRRFGFYAYMIDFITGPEDIIRFLCKTYKIHSIPIGNESVKEHCEKVPRSIGLFYSDHHVFSVKYSVYSGDKAINVKKLRKAKFFVESIDTGRIQFLLNRGKELESEIKNTRNKINSIESEINVLRAELENVKKKKRQLATNSQERELIKLNLTRATNKFKSIKETLIDSDEIKRKADEEKTNTIKKIQINLADLNQLSIDLQNIIMSQHKYELKYKISRIGQRELCQKKKKIAKDMSEKEILLKEMKEHYRAVENKCIQLKNKAKQLTNNISIEEKSFQPFKTSFSKLPNTIEELETEIEVVQTRSEFLQGGDIEVLQEYEKREEKIMQLTSALENIKKNLREKKLELSQKREEWFVPLNQLVTNINTKFGKYFEAMGCSGEVCLVHGENKDDLEKYGIKIKVKFRDGIPLEELGRYFQSGGERAVATAIYMLSLQETTQVPFRFVDEINQGMDPINERRILKIMIQVTSRKMSSQYFFITPKLLSHVECSRSMTIHCIHNGPFAIPSSAWNMKKFLNDSQNLDEAEDSD